MSSTNDQKSGKRGPIYQKLAASLGVSEPDEISRALYDVTNHKVWRPEGVVRGWARPERDAPEEILEIVESALRERDSRLPDKSPAPTADSSEEVARAVEFFGPRFAFTGAAWQALVSAGPIHLSAVVEALLRMGIKSSATFSSIDLSDLNEITAKIPLARTVDEKLELLTRFQSILQRRIA